MLADSLLWLAFALWKIAIVLVKFVIVVASTLLLLFVGLIIVGKIMDFFTREVTDPELGTIRIGLRDCIGKIALEGKRRTRFTLPAKKKEVNADAKAILLSARNQWPLLKASLFEHFAQEIEEEGVPPDLIKRAKWVEKLARERDYENLQRFTRLHEIEVEHSDGKNGPLQLRISTLHRWDDEHERVLVLDENLAFKFYGLGCKC
jgi:hypothetical protein